MFQVQPACNSPLLLAARQWRAGRAELSSSRCRPLACTEVRGRPMSQTVFSLRFAGVTARGLHVPTFISQRASSSGTKGEIQLPVVVLLNQHAVDESESSAIPGQLGVLGGSRFSQSQLPLSLQCPGISRHIRALP